MLATGTGAISFTLYKLLNGSIVVLALLTVLEGHRSRAGLRCRCGRLAVA